jgi:hypothetical protein
MGHRAIWLKFTEVSVESTASIFRIKEKVEKGNIFTVMEAIHSSETTGDLYRNTKLHGIFIFLFMVTAVRTSDPKYEAAVGHSVMECSPS